MVSEQVVSRSIWIFAALVLTGCSVSYSLEKSSDSISESLDSVSASFESFGSSSGSSGGEDNEVARALRLFFEDIRGLTRAAVERPQESTTFVKQVGELSLRYGISEWYAEPRIFVAIGSGLKQAGVKPETLSSQPILQSPLMNDHFEHILRGYLET